MTWLALGLSILIGVMVFTVGALTGALLTFHLLVTSLYAALAPPLPEASETLDRPDPESIKAAWRGQVREP